MSVECIQLAALGVQILTLAGLVWYAIETWKIRDAAQAQVKISQDQTESLARPCITLQGTIREGNDVIMERYDIAGNIVAAANAGSYVFQNIGTGPAFNVRYHFTRPGIANEDLGERYIPHIKSGTPVALPEMHTAYFDQHTVTVDYESIGKRKYRTTLTLRQRVITSFEFEEVKS